MIINDLTVLQTGQKTADKGNTFQVTNAEFFAAVFRQVPEGASAAVCSKPGDPGIGGWLASRADLGIGQLSLDHNNFVGCSSFYPGDDGSFKARKTSFAAYHFIMLDDLGTKIPLDRLSGFKLSWLIETSPENFQGGIILADPITDGDVAVRLLKAVIDAGLCDAGATGPLSRWARLPNAINGKPKHAEVTGAPFQCRLVGWQPEIRYTPQQIVDGLQLDLAPSGRPKREMTSPTDKPSSLDTDDDDILTPKAAENPMLSALRSHGLYKSPLGSGKHDITCIAVNEHTDGVDSGTAYFEPSELYPDGGVCCMHSHREHIHIRRLREFLGVGKIQARNKPLIRVIAGELHRVVNAAENELAAGGNHYQAGGLIVSISSDPKTGDPSIVPTSAPALAKELSAAASFEKFDARAQDFVCCDPPVRHTNILYDSQIYRHLPLLQGLARQPYFLESNGELITQAGYNKNSHLFGVFDSRKYHIPEPSVDAARAAIAMIDELLDEFRFATPADKSAARSAIFTAVVRPTLPHAPGYHVRAPNFASGKTYLCELIGSFAGPGSNAKVSYPTTSEEATKAMLSLLLYSPAVIEFDDMDTDWTPHGIIKRILTAEYITDRILGVSKVATVSTRSLILGSGNNVGPVRDLLRRVLSIRIDPRCATPATIKYKNDPVTKVRQHREKYVTAVLTIILAWRNAGMPRADVENIATYGGAWSDYCRHPLIWLGYPDPATALLEQVKHDPDADALGGLMVAWNAKFGSVPVTVRKAVIAATVPGGSDLLDAMRELPVEDKDGINRSKLGWWLKKNENREVNGCKGFKFQKTEADGRTAWRVVNVATLPLTVVSPLAVSSSENANHTSDIDLEESPPSPPSPPLPLIYLPVTKTVKDTSKIVEVEV